MAEYYHYTGYPQFVQIIEWESLLSENALLAKLMAREQGLSYNDALSELIEADRQLSAMGPNFEDEAARKNHVFLSKSLDLVCHDGVSGDAYKRGNMVVTGFDCPQSLLTEIGGDTVTTIELGLEYLTKVYSQPNAMAQVRELLRTEHNGKYAGIPVTPWLK